MCALFQLQVQLDFLTRRFRVLVKGFRVWGSCRV